MVYIRLSRLPWGMHKASRPLIVNVASTYDN